MTMRRAWRVVAAVISLLVVVGLGIIAYLLSAYEAAPVDPEWAVEGADEIPEGSVTVRYTGTSTLVFDDGETTWMTDGWFSRPRALAVLFGEIAPDLNAIEKGLARNDVDKAAAVFPVHSHYDHAMDAPEVAKRTGAVLLGSESTANIGRGWGLPESKIHVVVNEEPIQIGKFIVTPIESQHFQFADPALAERVLADPEIDAPLTPPVSSFDYKVGKAYAIHVAHPKGTWLIQASAGFVEGALEEYDADVVLLGVGALASQTDDYRESYWTETIDRTNPSRVIPIHWDSLTGPNEGPFTGPVRAAALLTASSEGTLAFLQSKEAANPSIEFVTLPRYDPVILF